MKCNNNNGNAVAAVAGVMELQESGDTRWLPFGCHVQVGGERGFCQWRELYSYPITFTLAIALLIALT